MTCSAGANYADYLIGVQSVVIDSADRLWILDTGRALTPNGTLSLAAGNGPKLIGVDLTNDTIFKTITFPNTVAYPDTYLNDVRFDLRANLTASGQGVAYITDSSNEGRNGLIIVDLGTGESWRHLNGAFSVRPTSQWVAYLWGQPLYQVQNGIVQYAQTGSDGIALSADGEDLYFAPVNGRYLFSVPTARLRNQSSSSELLAQQAVRTHAEKGMSDGLETDSNGFIYHGYFEQNAVSFYNPENGTDNLFVRDPRLNWIDTCKSSS